MNEKQQIKILNQNINLSILFIASVFLSILITYNEKLNIENKQRLFSEDISRTLSLGNRIFVVLLVLGFLSINKKEYIDGLITNKNIKPLKHQLYSSYFNLASSLIALYVVYENLYQNFQVFNIENPTI